MIDPIAVSISLIILNALTVFIVLAGLNRVRHHLRHAGRADLAAASGLGIFALGGWYCLALLLGWRGVYVNDPSQLPPHIIYGILAPLVVGGVILLSPNPLRAALDRIPLPWLIGVQFYRVIGVLFLILFAYHRLPTVFALVAGLGDVAVGLAAPSVAARAAARGSHWFSRVVQWNVAGILDLVIAVTLGFGSSPGPLRFIFGSPSARLITEFPLVLIPTFVVPLSLLLHFLTLRVARASHPQETSFPNAAIGDRFSGA